MDVQSLKKVFFIEGILLIILGFLAIILPVWFTFGTELFIGALLLVSGIVQTYKLLTASKQEKGYWWLLVNAVLNIIVGILFLVYPLGGVLTLTLLLAFYFVLEGIAKLFLGFEIKPNQGWGWVIVSGIASLVLAAIIFSGWPGTALWVIGLLLGINLLFLGASLIALSYGSNDRLNKFTDF